MPRQYPTKVRIVCQSCQQPFAVIPALQNRRKFCSRECQYPTDLRTRLFRKVRKTPTCWFWTGAKNEQGYGIIMSMGEKPLRKMFAHKVAYELHKGAVPDGMLVCHRCPDEDHPNCVNPDHLYAGTHSDNQKDAYRKGRKKPLRTQTAGEQHYSSKLSNRETLCIRKLYALGASLREIAEIFEMRPAYISLIVNRKRRSNI